MEAPDKKQSIEKAVERLVKKYFDGTHLNAEHGFLHKELIERVERELISQVLIYTENNQSCSAKILGVSRTTLRKKLEEYKL